MWYVCNINGCGRHVCLDAACGHVGLRTSCFREGLAALFLFKKYIFKAYLV
jgi:hypothetical protein